jgi:hypothetical protein
MALDSTAGRLPIQRIAITVPPNGWFYGIASALFKLYRQALVDLGLAIFEVPVDVFLPPDSGRISNLVSELRAFQPDLALGLPYGSYALICRMPPRRDGSRPNLFTDVLDIPTLCVWDHAPLELADQLLVPHPLDPAASTAGANETLRRILMHPRLIHWSRDSGQTQIMKDLGFLLPNHLIQEMPAMLPGFSPRETQAGLQEGNKASVGFVGHFYQEPTTFSHPALAGLAAETVRTWIDGYGQPLLGALERQIERLPRDLRQQLALDPDQTYFWHFAHRLVIHQAQTALRLKVLGSADVPVACYSNLRTDVPGVPENLIAIPTDIPYGPELAALFASHPIIIDVLSPGFMHGYSSKQIHGFSAGGFMLMNRKQDFVDVFGEAGEAVSFVDGNDLSAKVDRFLSNPRYRREVGDAIRETITAGFQLKDVLSRALHAAFRCAEASGAEPRVAKSFISDQQVLSVMNLLPDLRSESHWVGASTQHEELGARIVTAPQPWSYAAAVGIPPMVRTLNEPHLRVILIVESGRIGLSVLDGAGTLAGEQFISPSTNPVTITVELPHEGAATLILRNTVEMATRALVLEVSLCDRPAKS